MKRYLLSVAAAAVTTGLLALGGSAQAFEGHRGHFGSQALHACLATTPRAQKANLKQIFAGEKQTLQTDRQNVRTAQKALTSAILSGSKDVSSQESALVSAKQQQLKDQDSLAVQVCGQLTPAQLSAAETLYNNLSTLHETTHQQARTYFQAARAAAGNSQASDSSPSPGE